MIDRAFGERSCLGPNAIKKMLSEGDTVVKLGFLVLCDSLDEIYHGLFDAATIATFRVAVFYGLAVDSFGKAIEKIQIKNENKVDKVIKLYLDYRKGQYKVGELQESIKAYRQAVETAGLKDEYLKTRIDMQLN